MYKSIQHYRYKHTLYLLLQYAIHKSFHQCHNSLYHSFFIFKLTLFANIPYNTYNTKIEKSTFDHAASINVISDFSEMVIPRSSRGLAEGKVLQVLQLTEKIFFPKKICH